MLKDGYGIGKEEGYGMGKEGWDGVVINEGCNI